MFSEHVPRRFCVPRSGTLFEKVFRVPERRNACSEKTSLPTRLLIVETLTRQLVHNILIFIIEMEIESNIGIGNHFNIRNTLVISAIFISSNVLLSCEKS